MGVFDVFGKKKKDIKPLPPPPQPRQAPLLPTEFPPIKPAQEVPPVQTPFPQQTFKPPMIVETKPQPKRVVLPKPVEKAPVLHTPTKQLFISVSDYKRILAGVNNVRSKLGEADEVLSQLNSIKNQEQQHFERWRMQLEDIEKKLSYVDQVIAKAG